MEVFIMDELEKRKRTRLTPNEENFIREYLKTYNAYESYKKAYPNSSDASARTLGPRKLKEKKIRDYINEILLNESKEAEDLMKGVESRALKELYNMAFSEHWKYPSVKYNALVKILELSEIQRSRLEEEIKKEKQAELARGERDDVK